MQDDKRPSSDFAAAPVKPVARKGLKFTLNKGKMLEKEPIIQIIRDEQAKEEVKQRSSRESSPVQQASSL